MCYATAVCWMKYTWVMKTVEKTNAKLKIKKEIQTISISLTIQWNGYRELECWASVTKNDLFYTAVVISVVY